MKALIRRIAGKAICYATDLLGTTRIGGHLINQVVSAAMERTSQVSYRDEVFRFAIPNALCQWRAVTFLTKEPETLEWIDSIPSGSVLWDIGANIGLYSIYAARMRACQVFAFEPSIFNLETLARNVVLNGVADKIGIIPIALNDQLGINSMRMTTTEWGGALSTFGETFGWDGKAIRQIFEFRTIGLSMEDAVQKLEIPRPNYIKMDVDGLEHFILKGGLAVLAEVTGVLIEVNDDFLDQAERCQALLSQVGLVLVEKRHSDLVANSKAGFQNSFNQIWTRS